MKTVMHYKSYLLFFITLSILATTVHGFADQNRTIRVSASQDTYNLSPFMDVLKDETGTIDISDALKADMADKYRPNTSSGLSFGITPAVFWIRFKTEVINRNNMKSYETRVFDLGEAFSGRIEWSLFNRLGKLIASGGSKKAQNSFIRLRITDRPDMYYLKVQSTTSLIMKPRLFSWSSYMRHIKTSTIWHGVFYGIILAVAFYNLFLFFSFNDRSYLWYVLHLLFAMLYFLGINGISGTYFISDNPQLLGLLNRSFLGAMLAFMALLTRSFLMTRIKAPKADILLTGLFCISCTLICMNLFVPAELINSFLIITGILSPLIIVIAAWILLKTGFKPARLFLVSWTLFFIGALAFALTSKGSIPFTVLGFNGLQIGSALAAILLSLALGDRISSLRKESASLKQSIEKVNIILDSINSGVFLIDSKTQKILEINESAEKLIGRSRQEIIGERCWEFIQTAGDGNCPIKDMCNLEDNRETSLINADGKNIPVLKRARLIVLDGHSLIIESFVNISDLKRAEKSLMKNEAKLKAMENELKRTE